MSTLSEQDPRRNRLLAPLGTKEYEQFLSTAEVVHLARGEELYASGQPMEHVYFPLIGVTSTVVVMSDGASAEVGAIGNEGMVGLAVFFGSDREPLRTFQQVAGYSLKIAAQQFRDQIRRSAALVDRMHLFAQAYFMQISQSTACNRLHPVEERCARWLLMTRDRVHSNELALTQEFLAEMLGVRRPSVTTAASALQRAGMIRYSHGKITVVDPARLEEASCECYRIITDEYDRLLGPCCPFHKT